ncbi:hypothetical protein [Polaromonas sp. C04]|uniref:hypothetical protein n=1 Tax=Polaromonas sp. C04 TaxID=1945857 RepID=UPI001439D2F5|nr:hypothetical protein [Polaromonas sp. C04]
MPKKKARPRQAKQEFRGVEQGSDALGLLRLIWGMVANLWTIREVTRANPVA